MPHLAHRERLTWGYSEVAWHIILCDRLIFVSPVSVRQTSPLLLQCNQDKESRLDIYRSYILSNFNYCPLVCHFCGIQNSRNMEKIQERVLRFLYEDYESTYDILLQN